MRNIWGGCSVSESIITYSSIVANLKYNMMVRNVNLRISVYVGRAD